MKNGTGVEGYLASKRAPMRQLAISVGAATMAFPLGALAQGGEKSGGQVVAAVCSQCHATGAKGAPKIGDTEAWIPRLKNGLDATVLSAANGHGGIPARGGLVNLSDAELRSAISYMFRRAQPPVKKG